MELSCSNNEKKIKKKQIGRKILEDLSIVVHFMN